MNKITGVHVVVGLLIVWLISGIYFHGIPFACYVGLQLCTSGVFALALWRVEQKTKTYTPPTEEVKAE